MISMSKEYKTTSGLPVRIICIDVDTPDNYPVLALIKPKYGGEILYSYTAQGSHPINREFDLIEYNPLHEFKLDDPIMVRMHDNDQWLYRHFAGIKEGKPTTFDNGRTSFTNKEYRMNPSPWTIYRKPTKEELSNKESV
jgi:hypothetical protein